MANNSLAEITEQLKKSKIVAVFCHVRPDGDAIGSGLALCLALKKCGKKAYMCCDDYAEKKFAFLPATSAIKTSLPDLPYDTLISLDCADITRLGIYTSKFSKFPGTTVNIDHHVSNNGFAKYNYVVECPASCEIVYDLFIAAGFEIDPEIANLLMLGLITDSGNFTHLDVTPKTYSVAAALREKGADPNLINYNMYTRQSPERAVLYGRVMNGLRFALDKKFAYILIFKEDLKQTGADKSVTEGFVDFPLSIDGVEVAASLMEVKNETFKVSLRSKGKVNVNTIAVSYGGGGHVLASGFMAFGPLEEVLDKLTYTVSQYI